MKKAIPLMLGLTLGLTLSACGRSNSGAQPATGQGAAMMSDSSTTAQPARGTGMMPDSGRMRDSTMMRDTSGMGSMQQSPGGGSPAKADTSGTGGD